MSQPSVARPRINNIQALRAFAALAVVYLHCGYSLLGLPGFGSFGVDVFFVISGFVMALIVNTGPSKFFLRRIIRILPLYWGATLVVFALSAYAPSLVRGTRPDLLQLAKSLLFIPFRKSNGMLHPTLFLGWSLNFEMYFYAVIAIALLVGRKRVFLATSAIILAVVGLCAAIGGDGALVTFYRDPVVIEFLLGILTYWLFTTVSADWVRARWPYWIFGFVAGTIALVWWECVTFYPEAFPGAPLKDRMIRVMITGTAAFIVVVSIAFLSRGGFDTQWRPLILIGDASYVLYIIHPYVVGVFSRFTGGRFPWLRPNTITGLPVALLLTVSVSILVHLKIEKPATNFLSRKFLRSPQPVSKEKVAVAGQSA